MNCTKTNNLYKTINELCDQQKNWKQESISISQIDKLINNNLDYFFSPSDKYGMKAKFECLLNLSVRITKEFNNYIGKILAFAIQGIANEVLNEGVHTQPLLPLEIIDQIVYYMLRDNLDNLEKMYPKNSDLIWRKFKLNVDNAFLKLLEHYSYDLSIFGIKKKEAVDFIINHQNQLSTANLTTINVELLEKLTTHCTHLQSLDISFKEPVEQKAADIMGSMKTLKSLRIYSRHPIPSFNLALEKLTLLTELQLEEGACFVQNSIGKLTNLKSLRLHLDSPQSSFALSLSLEKLTSLTKLTLINKACQDPEVTSAISKMTSLTYLDLFRNDNIPENNLLAVLKKLTQLKGLNLRGTTISLDTLPLAIEKMMNLELLVISCYAKNDEAKLNIWMNVLKKLPRLKMICTDEEIIRVLQSNLKGIDLIAW